MCTLESFSIPHKVFCHLLRICEFYNRDGCCCIKFIIQKHYGLCPDQSLNQEVRRFWVLTFPFSGLIARTLSKYIITHKQDIYMNRSILVICCESIKLDTSWRVSFLIDGAFMSISFPFAQLDQDFE